MYAYCNTYNQICADMNQSPLTIGATLYRAFPKLGVSRRAQLRDALQDAMTE